ncbi:peptidoglycan-binding domain-containing protein [Saccharothrix syringae]|uniref:Peptidoglycan-binding protein n=1 Tax=Saccharothrix syringae TaxID=103733 RepID=A0A5Q0H173_SACSY|nr:peptidoglycan-binding domain-containing protein [Saccharothrix syringae]QFZ19919.1 peptidoglycan-binding protein [Saccharothrix syringae]
MSTHHAEPAPRRRPPARPAPDQRPEAGHLVELQRSVGNRGVARTLVQRRALTPAESTAAVAADRRLFDSLTVRVLQTVTGVPAANRDGVIGPGTVRATSDWQTARGLGDDGVVDQATMDRLVTESLAGHRPEHGIQLVLDFYDLRTGGDVLVVRHNAGAFTFEGMRLLGGLIPWPEFSPASTRFESGGLRVVEVGDGAFTSATTLRDTIRRELARPAPAAAPAAATPTRLTAAQARSGLAFTRAKYSDERSARAVQGLVGAPVTGVWDVTTTQFVAEAQQAAGIAVDGRIGPATTEVFYTRLVATSPNAALRLLVDFFDLTDDGNLLAVFFDPAVTALASTDFRPGEPVRVRVGPNALTLPFSGAVHNIAHELEHVRRLRQGITSAATHEFLGEALEVLSVGMPEEPLDPVNPTHDAFVSDATRCLANWNLMSVADRRRFRAKFVAVRRKVLRRIDAGTPAQRAAHAGLRANYVAVVLP